jgi:hypothetical protein
MSTQIEVAKKSLLPQARVAGQIVADEEDRLTLRMGSYLLEIPRDHILQQERDSEDAVIVILKPDAEVLMSTVAPVDQMIGVLSTKIIRGMVNPFIECCDCFECSYCSDCTECSYCIDGFTWTTRTMGMLGQHRLRQFRRFG